MAAHPAQLLFLYLLGLGAAGVLAAALYLLYRAARPRTVIVGARHVDGATRVTTRDSTLVAPRGRRHALAVLIPLVMLLWVFLGKFLLIPFFPGSGSGDGDRGLPGGAASVVPGASGAQLAVTRYGPAQGPALLFTHGWGADQHEWSWIMRSLPQGTRVVTWDLPGLGASTPATGEYTMAKMAADLDSVVASVKDGPVTLVGHSIGGMLNLEYARQHPERLGSQVQAIVQANTTYTNPVETKKNAERSRKLQHPVLEPALHVVIWASPVFRGLGWLAYQSGLAHLQLARQSFAGAESWQQLDQMARYAYRSSPRVVARGVLAMLHWDGSDVLARIQVPTLIISGDQDVTTLPVASDRMEKEIPSAHRVRVSPAAHMGPVEQSQRYAQAIATFSSAGNVAKAAQ
ncbi:MAG: Lysophospholipase, alpha-beta hydrolase superfamily [Ramlibacter sp.]|nr:Lysophospholipase, alpha-beta hydrolase superfamily [Ramlibacter sp.]